MPQKITLAFFSLALLSAIGFAGNAPNRDVTCPAATRGATIAPVDVCAVWPEPVSGYAVLR